MAFTARQQNTMWEGGVFVLVNRNRAWGRVGRQGFRVGEQKFGGGWGGGGGGAGGGVIQQNTYVWRRSFHVGKQTKTDPGGRGWGGGGGDHGEFARLSCG